MKRYILDSGVVTDLINHRNGVDQKAAEVSSKEVDLGLAPPSSENCWRGFTIVPAEEKRGTIEAHVASFVAVALRQTGGK